MKESVVRARINDETLKTFQKICDEKALNPSKLIRMWIDRFIKENISEPDSLEESPKRAIVST